MPYWRGKAKIVLAHPEDDEAIWVLYSRRTPDSEAIWYGSMKTEDCTPIKENIRIAEEAIKLRVEEADRRKQNYQG
ncbi:hypothetical protein H6G41_22040 [Tolypothrix sp. FACHB-123]|uniref:DUF6887 family protein n=1 Tax=Tolypothrix sp. FACHB-123 TaxID=2692868 RepID=UPI001687AD10|nr:hypothetical protein [Tolypothrix sp. FACHB-123]